MNKKNALQSVLQAQTPLGINGRLAPLDQSYVNNSLSEMWEGSSIDVSRAKKFLLKRVKAYYDVIGYLSPYKASDGSYELWHYTSGWCLAFGLLPKSSHFHGNHSLTDEDYSVLFNEVKSACLYTSLQLAVWEISQVVPESKKTLSYAALSLYDDYLSSIIKASKESTEVDARVAEIIQSVKRRLLSKVDWSTYNKIAMIA